MTNETRALIERVKARYTNVHNLHMGPADDDVFALVAALAAAEARAENEADARYQISMELGQVYLKAERAEAEVARLTTLWEQQCHRIVENETSMLGTIAELRAEVARLTAALEERHLLDCSLHLYGPNYAAYAYRCDCRVATLTPKEGTPQ